MIDFLALFANLNIPILRSLAHTAWLNILAGPLILIQNWWQQRLTGSAYALFNSSVNYNINNLVRYGRASYICTKTPAVGLFPLPTNTDYWYKILDDYIGITERSKYSAQKVMLEFALNRRFNPTTIQPPFSSAPASIYITNNESNPIFLWSAPAGTDTFTYVAPNSSTSFWYSILGNPTIVTFYNFTVNVPTAVVTSLAPLSTAEVKLLITQEINKYCLAGTTFNITIY